MLYKREQGCRNCGKKSLFANMVDGSMLLGLMASNAIPTIISTAKQGVGFMRLYVIVAREHYIWDRPVTPYFSKSC